MTNDTAIYTEDAELYTPLQRHFIVRLAQLVTLHEGAEVIGEEMERRSLIARAVYATIRDCEDAGVGDLARRIATVQVS